LNPYRSGDVSRKTPLFLPLEEIELFSRIGFHKKGIQDLAANTMLMKYAGKGV
jgi:hypothetical protein